MKIEGFEELEFESVEDLAKEYVALKSSSIKPPGEDASDEDWKGYYDTVLEKSPSLMYKPNEDTIEEVYKSLGKPDSADNYEIPEIDNQGLELDLSLVDKFKGVAHTLGLNQDQFKGVVKGIVEETVSRGIETKTRQGKEQETLKGEWGAAYDERLGAAKSIAKKLNAPKELVGMVDNEASIARFFHGLVERISTEGSELASEESSSVTKVTPLEAQTKMDEIRNNPEHPLHDPSHHGHQMAMERFKELAQLAYP
jgi:hypothetical protein